MTLNDLMEILKLEFENPTGVVEPDSPIIKTLKVRTIAFDADIDCITQDKDNIYLEIK